LSLAHYQYLYGFSEHVLRSHLTYQRFSFTKRVSFRDRRPKETEEQLTLDKRCYQE
jgi:hypothetical protein